MVRQILALIAALGAASDLVAAPPQWDFQETGFYTSEWDFGSPTQYASVLTARNGYGWPVLHAPQEFSSSVVKSYSLFAAQNPSTGSFWHELGPGVLVGESGTGAPRRLRGASHASGQYGLSVHEFEPFGETNSSVVLGSSTSLPGVQTLDTGVFDFTPAGSLYTPASGVPAGLNEAEIVDLAVSGEGEVALVTKTDAFDDGFSIWLSNPLVGWQQTEFGSGGRGGSPTMRRLRPESVDLEFDSSAQSTPHVAGVDENTRALVVYDFDAQAAEWNTHVLDTSTAPGEIAAVTLADNRDGVLGAAWVNGGVLKYATLDATQADPVWSTVTVPTPLPEFQPNALVSQSVGLEYDHNGLPMISYAMRGNDGRLGLWLAYDPPSDLPGDFNLDGVVDAADYTVWRDGQDAGFGAADYAAWRDNYGAVSASAAVTNGVPEPATAALLVAAMAAPLVGRRR